MASKNRHRDQQASEGPENIQPETGTSDDGGTAESSGVTQGATQGTTQSAATGGDVPIPDTDGVLPGYQGSSGDEIETDVVALPKKIVAKDIVGRTALKCTKKFIAEKDSQGNPKFKEDGSPAGEWEVTPPTQLYTVFGQTNSTETGTTNFGEWVGFIGDFEAVRTADGKRFKSNRLILQEPAQTLLMNALGAVKRQDPAGSVTFAFNVGKKTSQRWVDTNEGNSYEYTIESIISVKKHDPLAHMRKALLPHLPRPAAQQLTHEGPKPA